MRVVFCGTAAFAVPSLHVVAGEHEVLAVVTQPDRPGSRGRPAPRPVADAARSLGFPLEQPERIGSPEAVAAVLDLRPDALVVAAYGQIIPTPLLEGPRHGGINVHASLLPRWRGAAPVARALLAGDSETGVSIMRMDAGLDTGPVYARRRAPIPAGATTPSLTASLAVEGAELLAEVLRALEAGTAVAEAQDDGGAILAPRLRRQDGEVDWSILSAVEVDRRVRALQPWPGTTAPLAGLRVRLIAGGLGAAAPGGTPGSPASVVGESVEVWTVSGAYRVDVVQPPGGRAMPAAAFLRGHRAP